MDEEHGPVARGMAGHRGRSMAPIGSAAMKTSVAAYLALPIGLAMGYALQRHLGAKRTGLAPVWRVLGTHKGTKISDLDVGCDKMFGASIIDTLASVGGVELLELVLIQ
jgi:hypothetical protein